MTVNEALARLDQLAQARVAAVGLDAPPTGPGGGRGLDRGKRADRRLGRTGGRDRGLDGGRLALRRRRSRA